MITDDEISFLLAQAKVVINPKAKSREQRKSVQANSRRRVGGWLGKIRAVHKAKPDRRR